MYQMHTKFSSATVDSDSKKVLQNDQRRVSEFRAAHSVMVMKSVPTSRGQVIVFAGGAHLSCTLLDPLIETAMLPQITKGLLPSSSELLDRGEVTCLATVSLPGSDFALGVAGTTIGSLLFFITDGSSIHKVKEVSLQSISGGSISIADSIRDVVIGIDPAGRLEFVSATSNGTFVVADIHHFLDDEFGSRYGMRPVYFGASVNPHVSNTLVKSFTQCTVAKLLSPTRHQAAFTIDVALIVVLSSGTVRYVERTASGGSLTLFQQHQQLRQRSSSVYGYHHESAASVQVDRSRNTNTEIVDAMDSNPRLADITYQYDLSPFALETVISSVETSQTGNVCVNDAAVVFNASSGCMDLLLVGSQQQIHFPTRFRRGVDSLISSPVSPSGVFGEEAQGTLGSLAALDGNDRDSGAFSSQKVTSAAWWAVTERVVHPQATLKGLAKYKTIHSNRDEDHERNVANYVSSLNVHTVSRCERVTPSQVRSRSGLNEYSGLGISSIAADSSLPSSSSAEGNAVISIGADLYSCRMSPVTQKPSPEVRLDSPSLRTLPMLQHCSSIGSTVVESVLVSTVPLNADCTVGGKSIVLASAGSTVFMWIC